MAACRSCSRKTASSAIGPASALRRGAGKLVDRRARNSRIVRDCGTCRSVVLNGKLYLDKREDLRRFGLWALRLSFRGEPRRARCSDLNARSTPAPAAVVTRGQWS